MGIAENTIVFFTSDNGPQPGAWTDIFVDFFDGNGPFKGAKTNFYEGGIRTPMLVRWPGKIKAGTTERVCRVLCRCDADDWRSWRVRAQHLPKQIDGISYAPTLLGRSGGAKDARVSVLGGGRAEARHHAAGGSLGAIGKRCGTAGPSKFELYDLATDIGEEKNVAPKHPEVMAKIEAICREAHTPERVYGPGAPESVADYVR